MPLKKPDDTGYPKCLDCVFADVPASTPLLKVYDYGPLGARFFCAVFRWIRACVSPVPKSGSPLDSFNSGVDRDIFV